MYIGKITIGNEWANLENLIKAQVSSSFSFDSSKTYQLQGEGTVGIRLANASATPTDGRDGERIQGTQVALYTKDSGTLYVKSESNDIVSQTLKIDELS